MSLLQVSQVGMWLLIRVESENYKDGRYSSSGAICHCFGYCSNWNDDDDDDEGSMCVFLPWPLNSAVCIFV